MSFKLTPDTAQSFAQQWADAWNNRDIDAVLTHYAEDFSIATPMAAQVAPGSGGRLVGKPAIRAYWEVALARIPNLRFELLDVLVGVDALTIYYLNTATGRKAAEVLCFNEDGLVADVIVCYH